MSLAAEFTICTGLRQGELFRLSRADVNLGLDPAIVHVRESKNNRARMVPLVSRALEILEVWPVRPDGFVWRWRKRSGDFDDTWGTCRRVTGTAERLHWHDLRHFFAADCARAGRPIQDIARLLGNNISTAAKYVDHSEASYLRSAVAGLERIGS